MDGQKYSNEFLSLGVGARGHGMGNATVASTSDANAAYWNPAGLMGIKSDLQIAAMHSEWFAGVGSYDYLSIAKPIRKKKSVLGLSMIRFGIDDIPNTLSLYDDDGTINYNNIVPFSAIDYAFQLSYAQGIYTYELGTLTVGGNIKVIHRQIGPFATAWGFGLDLGLQYKIGSMRFGLLARDVTNTFNAWKIDFTDKEKEILELTNNRIPIGSLEVTRPTFILGIGYEKEFGNLGFLLESDLALTTDGKRNTLIQGNQVSIAPRAGIELNFKKYLYLRAGVHSFQNLLNENGEEELNFKPSMGVGFKFYQLRLDYAFNNVGQTTENMYSHVVSLAVDLNFDFFKKNITAKPQEQKKRRKRRRKRR